MGGFDEDYLKRFPLAIVEQQGRVVAFANMWLGADREEMCVDLMRYHHEAPNGVMEALFVHLFEWGKAHGFHWFALGMAPLSGFERSPMAPLWNRLGAFLYRHGEAFYGFQGLRAYKEKFNPEWEPRYLVYPGACACPACSPTYPRSSPAATAGFSSGEVGDRRDTIMWRRHVLSICVVAAVLACTPPAARAQMPAPAAPVPGGTGSRFAASVRISTISLLAVHRFTTG